MNFEQIVDAMIRLSDRYPNLEDDPDYRAIDDWLWQKAEEEQHQLTLAFFQDTKSP